MTTGAKATFRTGGDTNGAVRAVIGQAVVDRGGRSVSADRAIRTMAALVRKHWAEYLELLDNPQQG